MSNDRINVDGESLSSNDIRDLRSQLSTLRGKLEEARGERNAAQAWRQCAERLADEVDVLVRRKTIDTRSPAADALLDYREPPSTPRSERLATMESALAMATARAEAAEKEIDQLRNRPHLDLCSCASTALGGYGCICIAKMALDRAVAKEREAIASWLEGGWVRAYDPGELAAADAIREAAVSIREGDHHADEAGEK